MNYLARLERLRNLLQKALCDVVLIENPVDLFYLTGLELSNGQLLIGLKKSCLIVDGRYYEKSQQQLVYPVILSSPSALESALEEFSSNCLGFDQEKTTYLRYSDLSILTKKTSHCKLKPLPSLVQKLRLIKDLEEISYLKKAAVLAYQGYQYLCSLLKEGVKENELALKLEFFWKEKGAQRLAFDSIIAFDCRGSMPHYRTSSFKLESDQAVLMDIGVVLDHYHSDMTRVVFFGEPKKELNKIYDIVQEAKEQAFSLCHPGTLISELDQIARHYIQSKGYGKYFTHSLGHGIGLEIHEAPSIRQTSENNSLKLEPGMVITIEPGIYLPGVGGVRLEDTVLIQEKGYENLTCLKI